MISRVALHRKKYFNVIFFLFFLRKSFYGASCSAQITGEIRQTSLHINVSQKFLSRLKICMYSVELYNEVPMKFVTLLHWSPHIFFLSNKYLNILSCAEHHLRCRGPQQVKFLFIYFCTEVMKTSMDSSADCFALYKACQERYYIFPNLICQMSYLTSVGKGGHCLGQQSHR